MGSIPRRAAQSLGQIIAGIRILSNINQNVGTRGKFGPPLHTVGGQSDKARRCAPRAATCCIDTTGINVVGPVDPGVRFTTKGVTSSRTSWECSTSVRVEGSPP